MSDPRDCQCPRARHKHGTARAYLADHCRCDPCSAAKSLTEQNYRADRTRGQQNALISIEATRLRVQALMNRGWPMRAISQHLGHSPDWLNRILISGQKRITRNNAQRIAAAYDELWDKRPSTERLGERIAVRRTEVLAERRNYPPPMALDDDELATMDEFFYIKSAQGENTTGPEVIATEPPFCDEIAVREAIAGRAVRLTRREMTDAAIRLSGMGYSARQIGERLRVTERTVTRYRAKERAA